MLQRSNERVQDVSKRYNWCASKASMPANPSAATVLQILCTYLMKIVDSECVPAYITYMAARCSENGLALAGRNGKRSEQPGVSSKQDSRNADGYGLPARAQRDNVSESGRAVPRVSRRGKPSR
jgi:hypothetical protein